MSSNDSIFISAGDPSADFPGKNLIDEIKRLCPNLGVFGLGGPLMQKAGLLPLTSHEQLAVMGFWEVLPKFFFFRNLLRQTADEIEQKRPKTVILIDYPGFNLRLANRIRHLGIPIIYYISPQVWAWGRRRISKIRNLVDLMLVIFPFEESFYRDQGIPAKFTGHPIVDRYQSIRDKKSCRESLGFGDDEKVVALLPGSRVQEVKRMLPVMVEAASLMTKRLDNGRFVVAGIGNVDSRIYEDIIGNRNIPIHVEKTPKIINGADFVITSSGTATIESAFFTTPMVIIYKTGYFTYQIARRVVTLDSIGMVNIVAERRVVPELIQREASAVAIASHALEILDNPEIYGKMVTDLKSVRDKLGSGNAGRHAVEAIQEAIPLC